MESSKWSFNMKNTTYNGKHSLLPPKSPLPVISSSYAEYAPTSTTASKGFPNAREGNSILQRTSSESFLIEEQPSWLDDLLNEPETPVRRGGHRRSSSDSFAYSDAGNFASIGYAAQAGYNFKNKTSSSSWASQIFDQSMDARCASYYVDPNSSVEKQKNGLKDLLNNPLALPSKLLPATDASHATLVQCSASSCSVQDTVGVPSSINEVKEPAESGSYDPKDSSEKKESSAKSNVSEKDVKRAKQQFAQRSRVRKLQYIAELESNVQALQAEGCEISAELDFLNQQNLILSMENKTLKQRLESLAQEQRIKHLEHEVLERQIGRLRALYQLQQNPQPQKQPQQSSSHRRSKSRDFDHRFANLCLKHKESSCGKDAVLGSMHL